MNTALGKWLRNIILAGLFFVPFISLIITHSLYFPFITGKAFTFRILMEVLAALWVILMLVAPEYRPKKSWLLWLVSGLVLTLILSTVFSVNPYRSFWSNFERMEGLIGYLHLFLFFLIAGSLLTTEKWWHRFFKIFLGVSLVLSVYGGLQLFNVIQIIQGAGRVEATFGNATYFGAFLLITAFLSLYLWWRERDNRFAKWFYGGLFIFQVFMLFNTETRGAMLGLLVGLGVTALLVAWLERKRPRLRRITIIAIGIAIVLSGLFLMLRDHPLVQENDVLHRLATISVSAGQSRFLIWQMALAGFKENPILGWGPENFILLFNKYYNPQLFGNENWFDRAHNVFLDWLVHAGVIGFFIYVSLYATALYFVWRYRDPNDLVGPSVLTGLLAAYLIQNLFVFDNLMSYVLFLSLLAYLHRRVVGDYLGVTGASPPPPPKLLPPYWLWPIGIITGIGLVIAIYQFNVQPIKASQLLIKAFTTPSPEQSLGFFEQALAVDTFGNPEIRIQLSVATINKLTDQGLDIAIKKNFFSEASRQLDAEVQRSPGYAVYPLHLGLLLHRIGQNEAALPYLELARQFSPNKQLILFELASLYFDLGQKEKALELAKQAYESAPAFPDAQGVYLDALVRTEHITEAKALLAEVSTPDFRLINAFVEVGEYEIVLSLWQKLVEQSPDNVQYRFSLAATYLKLGQRTQAIKILEAAAIINPDTKSQVDYLINEIRAGRNPA